MMALCAYPQDAPKTGRLSYGHDREYVCVKAGRVPPLFILIVLFLLIVMGESAEAQQFNTDNYLAMPHGTGTFIFTAGTKYSAFVPSFALLPNWEVFGGAFLYPNDPENKTTARFSTTLWAKYMA